MHPQPQQLPVPFWTCDHCTVFQGDSLSILQALPTASVDAVVTDPPYSSGGLFRADRTNANTSDKYTVTGTAIKRPEFFGDNRDQRSFGFWVSLWMAECWRVTKPGGYLLCFTDWRQLPTMSDAIQAGGWVWRGIAVWDKTEGSKPQRGWFRAQAEFILTASHGAMGNEQERAVAVCAPGVFRQASSNGDKLHITGKPVGVMQQLMQVLPPRATVLDPFAGSGTTLLAAKNLGHLGIGIEMSAEYCDVIRRRLSQEVLPI